MPMLRQPDQLVDLSLHALCKFVSNLIDDYIENSCSIKDICLCLECLLKDSVPLSLANRVTENLLWVLNTKLNYIHYEYVL